MHRFLCAAGVTVILVNSVAADWTHFRGPDSTGVGWGGAVPLPFGPKQHLAWQADLPGRGLSSPVLVGKRVFLTAASGQKQNRLHVLAYDAKSGRKLWQRTVWGQAPQTRIPKRLTALCLQLWICLEAKKWRSERAKYPQGTSRMAAKK